MINSFYYIFGRDLLYLLGWVRVLKIFTEMGVYYGEQSGKGFQVKLKVSEEELEKCLESWDRDEVLLGFSFFKCYGTEQRVNMSFGV